MVCYKSIFSNDLSYILNNEFIILLSRCLFVFLSIITLFLLLKFRNQLTETKFLTVGSILFTLSYQLTFYYTSPGFMAAIVPFIIYLFISRQNFKTCKFFVHYLFFNFTI